MKSKRNKKNKVRDGLLITITLILVGYLLIFGIIGLTNPEVGTLTSSICMLLSGVFLLVAGFLSFLRSRMGKGGKVMIILPAVLCLAAVGLILLGTR